MAQQQNASSLAIEALVDLDHPIKVEIAEWAAENLKDPRLPHRDQNCEFWSEGWQLAADRGITGILIDPAYGGGGADIFTGLLTFEGLGYGCRDAGLIFGLITQAWTMQPLISQFGSDEQKRRYLPDLCSGQSKGAFCITEADSGSDIFSMTTLFETIPGNRSSGRSENNSNSSSKSDSANSDDRYLLNGQKAYVTMAPEADVFMVFATSNPELGQWGVTVFLVDADTPGLSVSANRPKMGLRTTPFADVKFEDCALGQENVLGSIGSGASLFSNAMESERAFVLASQVGAMEHQLDQAVSFSRDRHQFDQPIGDFQAVSHRLANMKLRHDNARLQLYRAAILHDIGKPSMAAAALAKIQASEASIASSLDAVLTHGARGYVTEFGVEQDLRNVAGGMVYGGTSDIQRNIVARSLSDRNR